MNFTKLVILALLCAQVTNAQSVKKIIHMPSGERSNELTLATSGIRIINTVSDSSLLGYVQKGLFDDWVEAVADKPLTPFLQGYTDRVYSPRYTASAPELLVVVQELRINERSFTVSQKAYVRLKAMVFAGTGTYQFLAQIDTTFDRGGLDVTPRHGSNIADALHHLLLKASGSTPTTHTWSYAQIEEKAMERYRHQAFEDSTHTDGVYLTYEAFLQDQPTTTDEVKECWGIRKNNQLYKYQDAHLIPIVVKQRGLALTNYLSDVRLRSNILFWGAVTGGPIAGIIIDKTYSMLTVKNIPAMKKPPMATTLDIETGEFAL